METKAAAAAAVTETVSMAAEKRDKNTFSHSRNTRYTLLARRVCIHFLDCTHFIQSQWLSPPTLVTVINKTCECGVALVCNHELMRYLCICVCVFDVLTWCVLLVFVRLWSIVKLINNTLGCMCLRVCE